MPRAEGEGGAAQQEQHGAQQGQGGPNAVGNGGPGTQPVIGVPVLFPQPDRARLWLGKDNRAWPCGGGVSFPDSYGSPFLIFSITHAAQYNQ